MTTCRGGRSRNESAIAFDRLGLGGQEPGRGGGLLVDLVAQAHRGWSPERRRPAPVGGLGAGRLLAAETRLAVCARVCARALVGNSVRAMPRLGVLQRGDRVCPATWQSQPARC